MEKIMKNVMVIDGAENCAYSIFQIEDSFFDLLFPAVGQDVEFIDDFYDRHPNEDYEQQFSAMWQNEIKRSSAMGVHGILFYQLDEKKKFYPNKRESDMLHLRYDPDSPDKLRWVDDPLE